MQRFYEFKENNKHLLFSISFLILLIISCTQLYFLEGSIINCVSTNITKAGIKAKLEDQDEPLIIFIARDHNYTSKKFSLINEGDNINVRIIGCRFELNDKYISAIAELVE